MRVSIALAAYNGGAYIADQLESFLAQTRRPDELVVVDDGSSDNTVDIVKRFKDTAPFQVVIITNDKNIGYAQNFGIALSNCSGDVVFLSDQDDVWLPDKIETVIGYMEEDSGIACFINDALLTDENLSPSNVTKAGQIEAAGLPETLFVMGCCVAVRRSLLDIALPIPKGARSHDDWLVGLSDCLNLTKRVPDTLQYYRRHGGNASTVYVNTIHRIDRRRRAREYLKRLMKRLASSRSLENEFYFYEQLLGRLGNQKESCIALTGPDNFSRCERRTKDRYDTLSSRHAIRASGIGHRIGPIAALWLRGGYKMSGGMAGAVKDLFAAGNPREDQ